MAARLADASGGGGPSPAAERLAHQAEFALDEAQPMMSARHVLTPSQKRVGVVLAVAVVAAAITAPEELASAGFAMLALLYGANIALRVVLYALGWSGKGVERAGANEIAALHHGELPLYSILVPLYDEANMMGEIARALCRLDYPADKLQISIILEQHDTATIAAARALRLDPRFEIIVVPHSKLRTKPRACNYALNFARGEFVVIFDAEDRPEPDQLKKAVLAFRGRSDVACFQARLAFYNADQSPLAKLFALEYGGWFAIMLPGLARLGVPLPLGGTSNHFRTHVVRAVGAWDAHNVTEDADLGMRLARFGHRAAPLDSTTYEEACASLRGWVRQRSRWLKGYMQTALVHARAPGAFARAVGPARYASAMLFVGGAAITSLVSPLMWMLTFVWWVTATGPDGEAHWAFFIASLVLGNGLLTILAMLVPLKTGERHLILWGMGACLYWLLISAGAYKGLWQLVTGRKSFWEKTKHGLTLCRRAREHLALVPRLSFAACTVLALIALIATACAALANPWPMAEGGKEVVSTLRLMQSADGFVPDPTNEGSLEFRAEYGVTDTLTFIAVTEAKAADTASSARLERAIVGARFAVSRWDTGVISLEGEAGTGAVRAEGGQPFFSSLHFTGEVRALVGQDFTVFGDHAWFSVEGGWRWRGGPPADEALIDFTLGVQPRDDLFVMLQSFGIVSAGDSFDGYRPYNSDKVQLSLVYEFTSGLWFQLGGIASVAGDDAGDAGGMIALWWRL